MTFQEEQDVLFSSIIDKIFFKNFLTKKMKNMPVGMELLITPECNLNCSYCYLNKHKDSLYPKDIRDKKVILNNLKLLLNYLEEKKLFIPELNLFSGEIWHLDFGIQILLTILEKVKTYQLCDRIVIPSNMTFILFDDKVKKIEEIMEEFQKYNVFLHWSASIDGKIIEDKFRPFSNLKLHSDDFYDKVFSFKQRHLSMGFHPMVSSKSCKYWIENYKWFCENFKKYYNDDELEPMMLEVRNADWTSDDILEYKKFLEFLINNQKEKSSSLQDFAQRCFKYGKHKKQTGYFPYTINMRNMEEGCAISKMFSVRLGDLSIPIGHRLSYDNLLLGKFVVEDDKIISMQSKNPELLLYIYTLNPAYNHLKCDKCIYKLLCIKGCTGAQYENSAQINLPIENVCGLLKTKLNFLIDIYQKEGLIEQLKKDIDSGEFPEMETIYQTIMEFLTARKQMNL